MKRTKTNGNHNVSPSGVAANAGALHDSSEPLKNGWINADTFGIAASALCIIHCAAMPVLMIALPTFASKFMDDHVTHYVLAFFVVAFCLFGIVPGYRKHKHRAVLAGMIVGVSMVLFATFYADPIMGPMWEVPIITVGNLLVVAAHLRNRKLLAAQCC